LQGFYGQRSNGDDEEKKKIKTDIALSGIMLWILSGFVSVYLS